LKENPSLQKSLHSAIANVTKILNDLNEAQRQNDQQFRHITKLIDIENSIDQCEVRFCFLFWNPSVLFIESF
jgi:hypothetical protein